MYVDDLLYAYHDITIIESVHAQLESFWKDLKWIGKAEKFLGMRVTRNRSTKQIHLNQERVLLEALDLSALDGCNPTKTPYDSNIILEKASANDHILNKDMKELYHTLVGKLSYVATNTRPDLAVIVSQLGSYVSNPTTNHFDALKRVLRGLDSTLPVLVGYSDSDWARDLDTRKSRTGYVFLLNDGCITWQSKKQPTVALSTSEAESSATQELRWLIQLLGELGFVQPPVLIHQDNQGCIQMAKGLSI